MRAVKIIDAKYLKDYKIQLVFNDKVKKIIDFYNLLINSNYPNEKKYLDKNNFIQFRIDLGDLIWNDFDMCFQAKNLYEGILRK
ncbi:MAG: hypothetical protein A2X61_02465 [Ignavibacteria bacterium GWB2_35_12]|nr:MAG: hypothetical protein A2X63_03640 [Ignavibacteria bacterium GWA2_35_8]OGU42443.1 MAG: hypothetical protein A2X61_02465 [Ignavibacteria bacterium GWB2_35_12]OGU96612.1 MAG: hypothetical protein A2220_12045 [Ignavibacteria bacterium RIFOXYA2_FULL_35_10]OGV24223.1 MAG: hypothetical protein A2475_08390 [Ignavibacteria bacterium RIFOXYC2_FULL_35_21]